LSQEGPVLTPDLNGQGPGKQSLIQPGFPRTEPTRTQVGDRLLRPMRDLRISVIDVCNFRCSYCMPRGKKYCFLDPSERLSFAEIERLTRIFASQGVQKIRLTGGEPLLRKDLPQLVSRLVRIPGITDISLTTNGFLLKHHAQALKEAGLKRISVSLDTLEPELFKKISGTEVSVAKILDGISEAHRVGLDPIKVNVVVKRGLNDGILMEMVEYFRHTPHILRFIEYMDVGNQNSWCMDHVVSTQELVDKISVRYPLSPISRNYASEVARRYRFDDSGGEIGFISSVTQPFCGDCSRVRLSTDGKIYTCLFANQGVDLRKPLRGGCSDGVLCNYLRSIWEERDDRHSELRSSQKRSDLESQNKVEMFHIGG
jgi:GTP 3',8-cyclase